MPDTIEQITDAITLTRDRRLDFSRPLIMGVLNVTPDSFSDGGRFIKPEKAVARARYIIDEGADIIDIGGESSRPGSDGIDSKEEINHVLPVIEAIRQITDLPISIDTTKAEVAEEAINAGADIINDISALRFDSKMAEVAAKHKTPVILMHMLGTPKTMQKNPDYDNCIDEIKGFFNERINFCEKNGIDRRKIIIDPGIGFGKRLQDNLEIIKNLNDFKIFGCPIMLGLSRKSFIAMITGKQDRPDERIGGSLASMLIAIGKGCNIVRVHDITETKEAIRVYQTIEDF